MSTVIFKKDHELAKKGTTRSVPYFTGKQLIAEGVAEYPASADTRVVERKAASQEAVQAELEATKQRLAELEAQNKKLNAELNEVLAAEPKGNADDYDGKTVEELHKLAADRNIEGRSALTTKADLVKALKKSDKK